MKTVENLLTILNSIGEGYNDCNISRICNLLAEMELCASIECDNCPFNHKYVLAQTVGKVEEMLNEHLDTSLRNSNRLQN